MGRKRSDARRLTELWCALSGYPLWAKAQKTLENYIRLIGPDEVEEAIVVAAERQDSLVDRWRYCCGVCRSKLAQQLQGQSMSTAGEPRET